MRMRSLMLLRGSKNLFGGVLSKRYGSRPTNDFFTLKMLTKEDCELCDEALAQISNQVPKEILEKVTIKKVDITMDGNEDLYDRWRYDIPVFYLSRQPGKEKYLCKHRIDINLLLSKLTE